MHTHFSAPAAVGAFLSVALVGTAWHLGWGTAIRSRYPLLQRLGRAAFVQY